MPPARRRLLAIAVGCLAAAAIAGCGEGAPSTAAPSSGSTAAGTAGVNLGSAAVRIVATDHLEFSPSMVTVRIGDIVQWTNTGSVPHTITFNSEPTLSDPTLAPGATWEIKFTKVGTFPYRCTIHPGMDGEVVVKSLASLANEPRN